MEKTEGRASEVDSRARARVSGAMPDPTGAKSVEQRVQHVMSVMELGLWHPFRLRELAATWAISVSRVKDHSSEAHRRLGEEQQPEEKQQSRRELTDRLKAWAAIDAEEGDRKAANKHLELVAKLQGLIVHQHEHAFQQEIADMLAVVKKVLPAEWYQKVLAALVAESKGDTVATLDS